MRFALSEEQAQLREVAVSFLADLPGGRAALDGDPGPGAWDRLVAEQGWTALAIPAEHGGWGFGVVELAVIFEALGARLTPVPFLGTTLATFALIDAGHPVLGRIADGAPAALAWQGDIRAVRREGAWSLTGRSPRVVDGDRAHILVLLTDQGPFVLDAHDVVRAPRESADPTRGVCDVVLEDVRVPPASHLGVELEGALRRGRVTLAAEAVGAAQAAMELAVGYAKVRHQFGRPIGSFQAIQHLCADMFVAVESARSATWYAAWALDAGHPDAELASRTACATATEACLQVSRQSLQVHGGIGFTWEHDVHLYLKRAQTYLHLLGSPRAHRAAVAAALLDRQPVAAAERPWT